MSAPPTVTERPPAPADRSYRRGMAVSGAAFAMLFLLGGGAVLTSLWLSQDVSTTHASPTFDGVKELRLSVNSATLTVNADAGTSNTTVDSRLRWSPRTVSQPTVSTHLDAGVLTVAAPGCRGGFGFHTCDVGLTLAVPKDVPVTIDTDSGSTTVTGPTGALRVKGDSGSLSVRDSTAPLTAEVDSGSVMIDRAAASARVKVDSGSLTVTSLAGDLTAELHSGSLNATDLTSKTVTVNADSGDTNLEFGAAPTSVKTVSDSGDTRIELPGDSGPYAVSAHVDSGSRSVDVPTDGSAARHIDTSNDSGDVTIDYR
jgi:hypothetical protein